MKYKITSSYKGTFYSAKLLRMEKGLSIKWNFVLEL